MSENKIPLNNRASVMMTKSRFFHDLWLFDSSADKNVSALFEAEILLAADHIRKLREPALPCLRDNANKIIYRIKDNTVEMWLECDRMWMDSAHDPASLAERATTPCADPSKE